MPYTVLETEQDVLNLSDVVKTYDKAFFADIESTGLDWWKDNIVLFQLKFDNNIYLIDVRKAGYQSLKELLVALNYSKNRVVFHNCKFDLKFLLWHTGILLDNVFDTMVAEAILYSGIGKQFYSLTELADKYADTVMEKESRLDFVNLPEDSPLTIGMLNYSALDVAVLEPIYEKQLKHAEDNKLLKVFSLDMDLLPIVVKMEFTGIGIDKEEWLKLESVAKKKLAALFEELKPSIADYVIAHVPKKVTNGLQLAELLCIPVTGKARRKAMEEITDFSLLRGWFIEKFNTNSSQQKVALLNLMGIKVTSSNKKIIAKHADNEVVKKFLVISEVSKQISMYGSSFLRYINPVTGRIHTEYFTVGTQTGRFSSQKPNLQNVPTHGGYRECFIPSQDYVFISCDYSQQEYRLAGAVSGEPIIIQAYKDGSDMHTATAAHFYKKSMKEVTKDERSWGKTRNFEIIYGTTEWGLSKSLKCGLEEAREVLDEYWKGYPRLHKFKEHVESKILELGYSITKLGRRRYNAAKPTFANPTELERWREAVKREGFNHVIQGGGADIIKIAMVNLSRKNPFGDKFRLLLQIHDELLVEVHKSIVDDARQYLMKEMIDAEQPFLGEIPAVVESEVKERWSK